MSDFVIDFVPVNCPNCGKFMGWDSENKEFTCSCGGSECIEDPNRPGWVTIRKKKDHRVHEYRRSGGTED